MSLLWDFLQSLRKESLLPEMNTGFKHIVLSVTAKIIPIGVLRYIYLKSGSEFWMKLLCAKVIHVLARKDIQEIIDPNKYICFSEDVYTYKVFNMCYMSNMLGKAMLATALGAVPIFEVKDTDGDNYFNQYFNAIEHKGQEILCDSKYVWTKKNAPGIHWDMSSEERKAYQKLYERYFVLKKEIKDKYDLELSRIKCVINSSNSVGVVLRGTDYVLTKPKGHPIQPDIDEIISILETDFSNSYYYVATDEEKMLKKLREKFGDRVISSDSVYYDGIYDKDDKRISYISFDRENDKYLRGFEYFRKLYVMSNLNCVAFGMSGASRMVLIMRKGNFEKERIIYRGLY